MTERGKNPVDEYDIGAAFRAIEEELIASMIRNMARHRAEETERGYEWAQWQVEQLRALERYRQENREKYGGEFARLNQEIEKLIRASRQSGRTRQERRILQAIRRGYKGIGRNGTRSAEAMSAEFFRLNKRKLEALIRATKHDMEKAETAVLRKADDDYRKAIFNAQVYANTGAGTYEKAVDIATKDMLSRGLNCVEYANGARHTLPDYADMALRTASKRAWLQGEGEKRQEWGISTVIVNKRGNPCPKCLPFCGKVLIDDVWSGGKAGDGPYPLMSTAVRAGLYHPRCKDGHTTYFPGISTADGSWTKEELQEIVQSSRQEARQQYAERQVEKYGRLARYSLDPENRMMYQKKKNEWEKTGKRFSDQIDLEKVLKGGNQNAEKLAKVFYHSLLNVNNDDIYQLLQQSCKRVRFKSSGSRRSYFDRKNKMIYLARSASQDTIAHELFHEIDRMYGITESGMLEKEICMDYARLQRMGGGKSLEDVLYSRYPEMFVESAEELIVKPEYRGISDIIHGMTKGQVNLGYRHTVDYWKKSGNLQRETWAQYGRMYYSENEEVLAVLKDIFPETTREFERIIKAVTK